MKIISEIGINYNGNFRLIEELIRQSAIGGADFAKFQLYNSIRVFGDDSRSKNEFTYEQVKMIHEICQAYNIEFFASVFDEEKIQWCEDLKVSCYKIASRTVVKEKDLCLEILSRNKKTFASLGQWSEATLPFENDNCFYFNCVSSYPTSVLTKKDYLPYSEKVVGISDHSYGIGNCLYEISRGASYVEKHFTLDKSMSGNDHIGSMDLQDLKDLKRFGQEIERERSSREKT
jgi:N,N'-diacetyllegionaminate synthase